MSNHDKQVFKNGDLVNGISKYFELLRDLPNEDDKTFFVFATVKTDWCPPCRVLTKVLLGNSKLREENIWHLSHLDNSGFWNNFIQDSPNIIREQVKELIDIFFDPTKLENLSKQKNGQLLEANKVRLENIFKRMVDKNEILNELTKIVIDKLRIVGVLIDGDNDNEREYLSKYGINIRGFPTTITFLSSVESDFIDYHLITGPDIKNFYIKSLEAITLFIIITYCE